MQIYCGNIQVVKNKRTVSDNANKKEDKDKKYLMDFYDCILRKNIVDK